MPFSCLIWADPRTGSSSLFRALADALDRPAFSEPFQFGQYPKAFAHIYENWCLNGDPTELYRVLEPGLLIKHISEAFDDNFNADLAHAAEYHGYRHIRLVRCNTFARLVSRGIAEQLEAWSGPPADITTDDLEPLDVPHLIADLRLDAARWQAVEPWLTTVLTVRMEELTSRHRSCRHACLSRIMRFLELPREKLGILDNALSGGGQNTGLVSGLLPNLEELRHALVTEGAA